MKPEIEALFIAFSESESFLGEFIKETKHNLSVYIIKVARINTSPVPVTVFFYLHRLAPCMLLAAVTSPNDQHK